MWVTGPDGEQWEVYAVLTASETFSSERAATTGTAGGPDACGTATAGSCPVTVEVAPGTGTAST